MVLREKEMAILRRTQKTIIQAMRGVRLLDRKNSQELMDMLGTKESLDRMAKASSMRWYGHVLRQVCSQEFAEGGCFGCWKQHRTILTQILIGLHSDLVGYFSQI